MTPTHHAPGGGFCNPWPGGRPHGFKEFLRWRLAGGSHAAGPPHPARDATARATPEIVAPRATPEHRSVTWVGHSTMLLQLGTLNVLTDPMWSERASPVQWAGPARLTSPGVAFEALPAIDVVLISHDHYDHLDSGSVRRLTRRCPDATWFCPLGVGRRLRAWGVRDFVELDWWQTVETAAYRATCTPAQHFSGRTLRDRNTTLWCGWTLAAGGARVFFAGDTGLHPEFAAIGSAEGPFDLVMLPIGAYEPRWFMGPVHMNPEDAILAYQALAVGRTPPACLPIHWGTFRLTDEPVGEPPERFAERWREAGFLAPANWTLAFGETRRF